IHARLVERIYAERRPNNYLIVESATQQLALCRDSQCLAHYSISTGANGLGGENNSFKTPSGLHQIADKIGAGAVAGLLFKSRFAQPLCATIETRPISTGADTITSRILRLDGLEPGVNKGGNCDSYERFIYIHGTAEEGLLGQAVSHGCIRMSNQAVIELFELVQERALLLVV
ncbi:MAG: L,D-transpeptidase family protein, partial [Granulosicoccaceae bacterium]